ncbi:helix-turn-helix domain-containing protein [Hymenobacter terrenus]|uniref:helix-turn-helix domain-containing protein n=1 Tax=Hymenobacter terrenus TaxID=1629124 RepID=UPI00061932F9|nr:helix-turn-helix domain-containing protein [Hymenobacter terrenus]
MNDQTPLPTHELWAASLLRIKPLDIYTGSEPSHRHNFFLILVLREVVGHHQIDFQEYPLSKNRIYFIGVGQVHALQAASLEGWLIAFDPAFLDTQELGADPFSAATLFNNWQRQPYIDLTPDNAPAFEALLLLLVQEYEREDACPQLMRNYLRAFLLNAERISNTQGGVSIPSLAQTYTQRLQELIEQHYTRQQPVAFYADQLGLSSKRLNDYTRRTLGKSVTQLLHHRLLVESKRLLLYSTLTVKEIAYSIGFEDPAYFSRFFKKQTTQYPERFRQEGTKSTAQ